MPRFRVNFTENHLSALFAVSRLVNATSQAIAYSQNMPLRRDYWKRYLNDLAEQEWLTSKLIYSTARTGKSGRKLGTLYAITRKGAEALSDAQGISVEDIFVPRGGIHATSPFQFPHRADFIELMGCFLGHEKASDGDFEILELHPYFRQEGANRLGTGKAVTTVQVRGDFKSSTLVPDAVMRFRVGEVVRLATIELHRSTDTKSIIEQLRKHASAIEDGLFSSIFQHPYANHVLSVHTDTAKLKNLRERVLGGEFEDFERYEQGFHFATLEGIIERGVEGEFWGLDGTKRGVFN